MDKVATGKKLREYLISKFGKLNIGAEKLGMSPQNLNKYLKGEFLPGAEIISKLGELGCDISWLLNIENNNKANQVSEESKVYTVKDKIILSQAEEIFELKKILKDLSAKIDELEGIQEVMQKVVGTEEFKGAKKNINQDK
jgi:transcriptional regulator with XRE-family HTH domain